MIPDQLIQSVLTEARWKNIEGEYGMVAPDGEAITGMRSYNTAGKNAHADLLGVTEREKEYMIHKKGWVRYHHDYPGVATLQINSTHPHAVKHAISVLQKSKARSSELFDTKDRVSREGPREAMIKYLERRR